jgi:hypothetical protein
VRRAARVGRNTAPSIPRSNPAPSEKKNSTRKKSRSGLRLSAMYREIGLVASATPPINAPMA